MNEEYNLGVSHGLNEARAKITEVRNITSISEETNAILNLLDEILRIQWTQRIIKQII